MTVSIKPILFLSSISLQNCPTFTDHRFFSYSEEKYYNESKAEGRLEYLPWYITPNTLLNTKLKLKSVVQHWISMYTFCLFEELSSGCKNLTVLPSIIIWSNQKQRNVWNDITLELEITIWISSLKLKL